MNPLIDDTELVERIRKGDVEAFDVIYMKYSTSLFNFGFKYLKSVPDAEELVQKVFLTVWETRKSLKKESSFKSYIFTIAYNDICKFFRRQRYIRTFLANSGSSDYVVSNRTEEGIGFKSILERVKQIISILPDRQRFIFLKSREEGKTSKEIAAELNLSPGTVDNYISDSLKVIRSYLTKEDLSM